VAESLVWCIRGDFSFAFLFAFCYQDHEHRSHQLGNVPTCDTILTSRSRSRSTRRDGSLAHTAVRNTILEPLPPSVPGGMVRSTPISVPDAERNILSRPLSDSRSALMPRGPYSDVGRDPQRHRLFGRLARFLDFLNNGILVETVKPAPTVEQGRLPNFPPFTTRIEGSDIFAAARNHHLQKNPTIGGEVAVLNIATGLRRGWRMTPSDYKSRMCKHYRRCLWRHRWRPPTKFPSPVQGERSNGAVPSSPAQHVELTRGAQWIHSRPGTQNRPSCQQLALLLRSWATHPRMGCIQGFSLGGRTSITGQPPFRHFPSCCTNSRTYA
jgi:hypothetical protein